MASDAPASPRHALLAENLGKRSLWVIIKDLWYKRRFGGGLAAAGRAQRPVKTGLRVVWAGAYMPGLKAPTDQIEGTESVIRRKRFGQLLGRRGPDD